MRGTVANRLRREVFGDFSLVVEYGWVKRVKKIFHPKLEKMVDRVTGQIVCKGRRAEYKKAKKAYYAR